MKRIITIQEISCIGKCSGTVALPIISAAGVECGIIPTAILSTHPMFPGYTFRDLTEDITPIANTFMELGLDFDAIYSGYLSSILQIDLVSKFFSDFGKNTLKLVDPAMGDNGALYKGFTLDFAKAMSKLVSNADIAIPNLTEASYMLGIEYREAYDEAYIKYVLRSLTELGCPRVALTGIGFTDDEIGVYSFDSKANNFFKYFNTRMPLSYHGTGDIFASATLGGLMRGMGFEDSLALSVDYTLECIKCTMQDEKPRFYGVNFEEALPFYISRIPSLL